MHVHYINDRFVSQSDAALSALDLGILRGYGVFDLTRTYGGVPFHLHDHLKRLEFSAKCVGLQLPKSFDEIAEIIVKLLKKNQLSDAVIRMVLTGGKSDDGFFDDGQPTFMILIQNLPSYPKALYEKGISLMSTHFQRFLPECKTLNYLPALVAIKEAKKKGADDILYLNPQREVLETSTGNFFGFKKNILYTPPNGILFGITREVILRLAKDHFEIKLESIPYESLPEFDASFVTSSIKEIMPICQIDDHIINPKEGEKNTKKLIMLFRNYTQTI